MAGAQVYLACSMSEKNMATVPDGGSEGDLRLVDSTSGMPGTGRLEVFHAGAWGTVCDDSFGQKETAVACRQLGYASGTYVSAYAEGPLAFEAAYSQPIWLDEVTCSASCGEARLVDCMHRPLGGNNCIHGEDVRSASVPLSSVRGRCLVHLPPRTRRRVLGDIICFRKLSSFPSLKRLAARCINHSGYCNRQQASMPRSAIVSSFPPFLDQPPRQG